MPQSATLLKRFASCLYELLLLIAIWMLCTLVFVMLFGSAETLIKRSFLQFFLWLIAGVYFVWSWHKTGQTLAAQTWKIRLVDAQNKPLGLKQSMQRYALATASILACGLGLLWAFIDKDHLFLHDRLLKTRLIQAV
jgi:uncharacterized RDD family membrane protein YckC